MTTHTPSPHSSIPSGAANRETGGSLNETVNSPSLGRLARSFADIAHAMRVAADHPPELGALEVAFSDIKNGLSDLAVAFELTANAVIAADRRAGALPTQVPPTPYARAISWRLRALATELRASREACAAVHSAARDHADIKRVHRSQTPGQSSGSRAPSDSRRAARQQS
jgi:hypothetical protein